MATKIKLTIGIALSFVWLLMLSYFIVQDGHIRVNDEWAKIYMLKGGYRSWTVYYSHGKHMQPDGKIRNLWKWPHFHYADIRKLDIEDLE